MRRWAGRCVSGLVAAAVAGLSLLVPGTSRAESGVVAEYVALGDSYTSGSLIPTQLPLPIGCERSDRNYPSLVRAALRPATFRDVSCGGATTGHLTVPQPVAGGPNPPQLDALTPSTSLVTIGIGANNIGFAEIATSCTERPPSEPFGAACRDHFQRAGRDLLADRIAASAPQVAAALHAIRSRAPMAKVLVIGYPTILPPVSPGCAPLTAGDASYLGQTFQALNDMLHIQADRAGVGYVDTARGSLGHDVCQPTGTKWVEGSVATSPAAPWHPNALSMRHTADRVLEALHAGS